MPDAALGPVCCRHVLKWDVSDGDLGQCLQRLPLLTADAAQQAALAQRSPALLGAGPEPTARLPPAIRGLDAMRGNAGVFVAGKFRTCCCG
jgi:hypothetical protein